MYKISDGGKQAFGFTHEKNDCTVRAVSFAYGIPYNEAHAKLKSYGRKDGKGFTFISFIESEKKYINSEHSSYNYKIGTLRKFLQEHPTGTFILIKRGHAFAVIDGVVYDSWKPGMKTQILQWWQIK